MELKGSKTEKNLEMAFAGESQARNKYTYYASQAKKEGYEQIAAIFLETAENEKEHAKMWFKYLHDGQVPTTVENLKAAAEGENFEWTNMYKKMAEEAKAEGFKKKSIVCLPNVLLDKLLEYINDEDIEGITGAVINDNVGNLDEIKELVYQSMVSFDTFKLNSDGLIPVIVQDYKTNQVLMLAYMNKEAYEKTLRSGTMTYFSRSRQSLWLKGETSGHFQYVKSLSYDCDSDTLLAKVEQIGAACHTGAYSCFFNDIITYDYEEKSPLSVLTDVYDVIMDRKKNPKEGSYTNYLFDKGIDKILKKVGEEATEIVIAAKNPNPNEIKYEISDFLYHVMVLMAEKGVTWDEIMTELANR